MSGMNTAPCIDVLLPAILAATRDLEPVVTSRFTDEDGRSYTHATLTDIMGAICPVLFKHRLMIASSVGSVTSLAVPVAQNPRNHVRVRIVTRLFHASGQWIENAAEAEAIDVHEHAVTAATTRARRTAIVALLNLQTIDEDIAAEPGYDRINQATRPLERSLDTTAMDRADALQTAKRLIERAMDKQVLTTEALKAMVRKHSDGKHDTVALLDDAGIQTVMRDISKLLPLANAKTN